ncbi:LemA family protein [Novosphingobium sp. AAP93]|uniref:LemA family protein n=1 Tax=Novosphingobium sp. AAP93 TaxID=1523427 RepID=UPI0006B9602B|nr:LemA family protein [Novosphingobium sp. AAP93]
MQDTSPETFWQAIDLWGRAVRSADTLLDLWWLWLVLGFVLWLALRIRAQHALIAQLDERADAAFGDVDALLLERKTLIGNLVEVVRAYAAKEHEVIRDVLSARVEAISELGEGAMIGQQNAAFLQNLVSLGENFPELESGSHFAALRTDLVRIEDRITAARKFYNLAVEELNSVARAFPGNLIASFSRLPLREKFSLGERRGAYEETAQIAF